MEATMLFPREIAVLRAVQGSFNQLREQKRSVEGLVLQVATRLDEVGERVPGYWRADNGKRVRGWLLSPCGLPSYPRIRRATSPMRGKVMSPPKYQQPQPEQSTPAAAPTKTFRRAITKRPGGASTTQNMFSTSPPETQLPGWGADSVLSALEMLNDPTPISISRSVSPQKFQRLPSASPSSLVTPDVQMIRSSSPDLPTAGSNPSSVVAASWQLYDEALRRFCAACDESDSKIRGGT